MAPEKPKVSFNPGLHRHMHACEPTHSYLHAGSKGLFELRCTVNRLSVIVKNTCFLLRMKKGMQTHSRTLGIQKAKGCQQSVPTLEFRVHLFPTLDTIAPSTRQPAGWRIMRFQRAQYLKSLIQEHSKTQAAYTL